MRIAFIANNLRSGGGKIVMINLLPEFLKIIKKSTHDVLVILPHKNFDFEKSANIRFAYSKGGNSTCRRFIWQKIFMENMIRNFKPDWTFAMGNYGINRLSGKQSVLLHNSNIYTNYAKNGSLFYRFETYLKKVQFQSSLKSINRLYFQTDLVKNDFYKQFPNYRGSASILPLFIPVEIQKEYSRRERHNLDGFFNLVYPANSAIHKNQQIIVKTFVKYKKELAKFRCFLTLDPIKNQLGRSLYTIVKTNGLESNIIFTGTLSRAELSNLYRSCDAMLMPSKLETLGLPYIEAMHFSLPIITTDANFSRAVCADAAIYCDSSSEESLKNAIMELKNSPHKMEELRKKEVELLKRKAKTPADIVKEILKIEGID